MDDKVLQTRRDLDALASSLEDEKSTYLAFQKIKERIVPSIEAYQKQVDGMETEVSKMAGDITNQRETIKQEAKKIQESLKGGEIQSAMKISEEITDRKKMLEDIKQSIEELSGISENLNKRITLLSREAKLLEIRNSGGGTGAGVASAAGSEAKSNEIRQELTLSEAEEREFRAKREELKNLIKKLWETQ